MQALPLILFRTSAASAFSILDVYYQVRSQAAATEDAEQQYPWSQKEYGRLLKYIRMPGVVTTRFIVAHLGKDLKGECRHSCVLTEIQTSGSPDLPVPECGLSSPNHSHMMSNLKYAMSV